MLSLSVLALLELPVSPFFKLWSNFLDFGFNTITEYFFYLLEKYHDDQRRERKTAKLRFNQKD